MLGVVWFVFNVKTIGKEIEIKNKIDDEEEEDSKQSIPSNTTRKSPRSKKEAKKTR